MILFIRLYSASTVNDWSFPRLGQTTSGAQTGHIYVLAKKNASQTLGKWFQHPSNPGLVICFDGKEVKICLWENLNVVCSLTTTTREQSFWQWECMMQYMRYFLLRILKDLPFDWPRVVSENHLQGDYCDRAGDHDKSGKTLTVVLTGAERPSMTREFQLADVSKLASHVLAVTSSKRLIFIDKKSWVCSVDLESVNTNGVTSYTRHFFLPHEWIAGSRRVICSKVLTARKSSLAGMKISL